MKKSIIAFSLVLGFAITFLLPACSDTGSFRSDVSLRDISDVIRSTEGSGIDYYEADEDYLKFVLSIDADLALDSLVFTSDALEQYGIFKVSADKKADLTDSIKKYIAQKAADDVNLSYFPGEEGKVKNAAVLEYGDYLVYLMIDDAKRPEVESAIKNLLTK